MIKGEIASQARSDKKGMDNNDQQGLLVYW